MTVATLDKAKVTRAKALLKSAAGAAQQLEADIDELVSMRAWDVLGYENFNEMWAAQLGYEPPNVVKVLAVGALAKEEDRPEDGWRHKSLDVRIAKEIGYHVSKKDTPKEFCNPVRQIVRQLDAGVPPDEVGGRRQAEVSRQEWDEYYAEHPERRPLGGRKPPTPKRIGAGPEDLVSAGFNLPRRDADAIHEIARAAGIPDAEIYRQAVAEFLERHAASRPKLSDRKS